MKTTHKIDPALESLAVAVGLLTPDPGNARLHNEPNLDAICDSLRQFGQRAPIVVQRDGMVVRAGNGRLMAAKRLGWTHIAAVVVDEPEAAAKAFALADNRSSELASWDYDQLAEQFADLSESGFDLTDLGWNDDQIMTLIGTPEETPEETPEVSPGTTPAPSVSPERPREPREVGPPTGLISPPTMSAILVAYHRGKRDGETLDDWILRLIGDRV